MKVSHHKPKQEKWEIKILPYFDQEHYLVEEAPMVPEDDEWYRSMYRLKQPIREWLETHDHKLDIDRGDWGEGAEHFYITLYSKDDVDDFKRLCQSLK